MTVAQAFQDLIKSLNLTDDEKKVDKVIKELQQKLAPREVRLFGSVGRSTAIHPLNDIDVFLELSPQELPSNPTAGACLTHVEKALKNNSLGPPEQQRHSVHVKDPATNFGYDIVPALRVPGKPDVYRIPERDTAEWIQTNPPRHQEVCNEADKRAHSKLRPLIKLVKGWNYKNGKQLGSFHLEAMSYSAPINPDSSYQDGLRQLFEHLSKAITQPCPDPAGVGEPIDTRLRKNTARLQHVKQMLEGAAHSAKQAWEAEQAGNEAQAHQIWRNLLKDYPG